MVVGKDQLSRNRESPSSQIAQESVRITETAESKEGTGTNFTDREQSDVPAETAESKQARRSRKNGILMELPDGFESSRRSSGACKNNQLRATHGRYWFPESTGGQEGLARTRPRRVPSQNVPVPGELEVLKTVLQKKNSDLPLR